MTGLLSPTIALGAVLSTAYAALFHVWQKGDITNLRHYLVAAWLGFAAGHILGDVLGFHWLQIGQLNVASGTIGAALSLLIARSLEE
jgi:H+/Cl- antiporter ClcA